MIVLNLLSESAVKGSKTMETADVMSDAGMGHEMIA